MTGEVGRVHWIPSKQHETGLAIAFGRDLRPPDTSEVRHFDGEYHRVQIVLNSKGSAGWRLT